MGKKVKLIIIIVVCTIAVAAVWFGIFMFGKSRVEDSADPTQSSDVSSQPTVVKPKPTPDASQEVVQPPKELHFQDSVTIRITGDDYTDGDEDVEVLQEAVLGYNEKVDGYDFSNGFYLIGSDNIHPVLSTDTYGTCRCESDGFSVIVKEHNALQTDIYQLREYEINRHGLSLYNALSQLSMPRDCGFVLDEGLPNYQQVLGTEFVEDPTVSDMFQICADVVEDTAYGSALFSVFYNMETQQFDAYAFISCDRDRILEVNVTGGTYSQLWSYVLEATNDVIRIIK